MFGNEQSVFKFVCVYFGKKKKTRTKHASQDKLLPWHVRQELLLAARRVIERVGGVGGGGVW